ncbi:nucleolar GTP-binding protein 1 isoform X2 [Vitis riparia]|uniref:nucleolar GTP-binding protein 1 isoform X2 n=1 Tax=Vitis riparia TaxID=96939 RepID=UPI00155B022A|nr:nucleolar GTP-binding protein 1 isoform X2 [Vitis riparia]
MSGTSHLIQLWHIPSTKLLLRSSNFSKGSYLVPAAEIYPTKIFCKKIQTTAYRIVNGSYVPVPQNKKQSNKEDIASTTLETVGAFQKLPMVMPSVDILYSAMRKAKRVSPTKGIANIAKRERNRAAKQLDFLMKELAVPLRGYAENFPDKKQLHPYEQSLVQLTLGDGNYEQVLRRVDALRKKVVSVGKEHASLCAKSLTKREAEERLGEGMKKLEDIFNHEGKVVDDLLNIAKVCNYPFTTRGILMGHIAFNYRHFQVTDTPGLLNRHDDERNNLEKLTLAVLSHLPTAILYVHDLSGECGTSPSDQFFIYKEIRERFSDHLWIDVVSKCDLLQESPIIFNTEDVSADNPELARYQKMGPEGAIRVSVKNEAALNQLKGRVHELLVSQMSRIKSSESNEENKGVPT